MAHPSDRPQRTDPKQMRIDQLEDQLMLAKILARRFWKALKARPGFGVAEQEAFEPEALRIVDVTFDAAAIVWERHRIIVEPCRQVFDYQNDYGETYIGRWPDTSTQNLTRQQLLMMAGYDVDA